MKTRDGQAGLLGPVLKSLKDHREVLRVAFAEDLKSASIFLMLVDSGDAESVKKSDALEQVIKSQLDAVADRFPAADLSWPVTPPRTLFLQRFLIRNIDPYTAKREIENSIHTSAKNRLFAGRVRIGQNELFIPRAGTITCRSFAQ